MIPRILESFNKSKRPEKYAQADQPDVVKSLELFFRRGRGDSKTIPFPWGRFEDFPMHYYDWKLFKPPLIHGGLPQAFNSFEPTTAVIVS